jgi:hypothetical protein
MFTFGKAERIAQEVVVAYFKAVHLNFAGDIRTALNILSQYSSDSRPRFEPDTIRI